MIQYFELNQNAYHFYYGESVVTEIDMTQKYSHTVKFSEYSINFTHNGICEEFKDKVTLFQTPIETRENIPLIYGQTVSVWDDENDNPISRKFSHMENGLYVVYFLCNDGEKHHLMYRNCSLLKKW